MIVVDVRAWKERESPGFGKVRNGKASNADFLGLCGVLYLALVDGF